MIKKPHSQEGGPPSPPSLQRLVGRAANPVVDYPELFAVVDVAALSDSHGSERLARRNAGHSWRREDAFAAALVDPHTMCGSLNPPIALGLFCMAEVGACKLLD